MYCKVICGTLVGIKGILIDVEVDINEGFPKLDLVGMAGSTIKESKERVRTGIKNSGYNFPYKRITINLAPAHIRKEGVAFDLPIALGILCCEGVLEQEDLNKCLIVGELALNGKIRPVKGVLSLVDEAKKQGITKCMVPLDNYQEACIVSDVDIICVRHLKEAIDFLRGKIDEDDLLYRVTCHNGPRNKHDHDLDFSQVIGQKHGKRGLEIAVSGMHHVMLTGPPGIGKTMLAKRVKTILPPLKHEEKLELTKIYSAAEKLIMTHDIISERPFRNPHHSITRASFIGGSSSGKPGEISLAHRGVLMLDEFPEFKKDVIESLREPLEQGNIILSRNQNVFTFPADFILIAAMNPCPCGYYPNTSKCTCLPNEISKYQHKISGPVMDRIDLFVEMSPVDYDSLSLQKAEEASGHIAKRVMKAHQIQQARYKDLTISYNSQLTPELISKYCNTDSQSKAMLKNIYQSLDLSSRAYHRILKIARTIADMEGSDEIILNHVVEALSFRTGT